MNIFKSILISVSTFSIIPTPGAEWKKENLQNAIYFLPLVGAIIGAVFLVWQWIYINFNLEPALFACVASVLPLIITGGIHMDGYMDTIDALAAHQEREKKLEIMKDSRCGAFAVMFCCVYMLLTFGFYFSVQSYTICIGFVLSRFLGVLSTIILPNARKDGILSAFSGRKNKHIAAIAICSLTVMVFMVIIDLYSGIFASAIALTAFILYIHMAKRQFGGATGDTSGFFIQVCELCILFGSVIGHVI